MSEDCFLAEMHESHSMLDLVKLTKSLLVIVVE